MAVAVYNNTATIRQEKDKNEHSITQIEKKDKDDLELEKQKAKYTLILQAIATNDRDLARNNLEFFINAGLLDDNDKKIQEALTRCRPVLPGLTGGGTPLLNFKVPEIAKLYDFPLEVDGAGQVIGLVEFGGGINLVDLSTYFKAANLAAPEVVTIPVGGGKDNPKDLSGEGQVMMDIEVVGAVPPKAQIRVYFAPWALRDSLRQSTRPYRTTSQYFYAIGERAKRIGLVAMSIM